MNIFKSKKDKHPLAGYTLSALASDQRCDDVLFVCHKPNSDFGFAIVHLTWQGKVDQYPEQYPATDFFKDFKDVKSVLDSDASDWEN